MGPQPAGTGARSWPGLAALVACAILWSLNGPLIKLLHEAGASGISIAFYRSCFGVLIFVPLGWRGWHTLRGTGIGWPIGSVLAFTVMTLAFVVATTRTAAANAIILQYTSPVWVFLLSPLLLHERPHRTDALMLALAMAGVGVIFLGHRTGDVPALVIGLIAGLGYGSLTVALRGLRRANPSTVVALNTVGSTVLLVPVVAIWATFDLTRHQFLLLVLLSVVQFALPYLLFSWALQRVEAHQAALIVLLEAVLNPLQTFLIVGERVPTATLIGGPLILLGVAGGLWLRWRRQQATNTA